MNKKCLHQKRPSCLAALSPATSPDMNHSPLTIHHSLKRKSAFTLAEVLITLGIIGVVAALTLPTIIHKYQAKVLKTQFLQANTILQDGILRMRNDEVDLSDVINGRKIGIVKEYFAGGNCNLPKNEEEAGYENYFGSRKAADAAASDLVTPYCLKNGMLFWFVKLYNYDEGKWYYNDTRSYIAIDINGWKHYPDRYGMDVFFWVLDSVSGKVVPVGNGCVENNETWAEAGISCTAKAISDPDYFDKIKFSR